MSACPPSDKENLQGNNVLVTGGSQGLGFAIAQRFVESGANVIIVARTEMTLSDAAKSLKAIAGDQQTVLAVQADISKPTDCDRIAETISSELDGIDVLVNNAGIFTPIGKLTDVPWAEVVANINTNVLGTIYMCKICIPLIQKRGGGKIINISGGGAARAFPAIACYASGKMAVIRFSEELAEELIPLGIDVNVVAPGPMNTRFVDIALQAGIENLGEKLHSTVLDIRKNGGDLDEVASLCAYLSSDRMKGLTGKLISAKYDDWRNLHNWIDDISQTEIFTMRRIDEFNIQKYRNILGLK